MEKSRGFDKNKILGQFKRIWEKKIFLKFSLGPEISFKIDF